MGEFAAFEGCATFCPKCGGQAEIGDGQYHATSAGLELIAGDQFTHSMVERLRTIADRARERLQEKSIQAEEVLAEIADVSPEFAQKLRSKGLPVFALVLLLIWLVKSVSIDVKIDFNHLVDQAYHISQQEDPESHLDKPLPIQPAPSSSPTPGYSPGPLVTRSNASTFTGSPVTAGQNRRARRMAAAEARRRPKLG